MDTNAAHSDLRQIPVAKIERNKDNPRILFRQLEMDELVDSIRQYGILVPISVYKSGSRLVLIDGERRWRCALKLNKKTIPALIQPKPSKLDNILLMFNIHALREQWDLLTIALKLHEVIALMEKAKGRRSTEAEIAKATGLARGTIRRCRLLIELPARYQEMILNELKKPKPQQRLTEDFFIEMERALKTVARAMPEVVPDKDKVRRVLIQKFRAKTIDNRVHFRDMAKIARAERVHADPSRAKRALRKLFVKNDYSIQKAYGDSVSDAYTERDVLTRLEALIDRLREFDPSDVDDDVRNKLEEIIIQATRLLEE